MLPFCFQKLCAVPRHAFESGGVFSMLKPTATVPVSTQGRHGDGSWCKYKQMIPLNLPSFNIKTKVQGGRTLVFDFLRRRYVTLTPEEWVRQHFVHFLVEHKGYPAALLGNEVGLKIGGVSRRCDSVLYHRDGGRPRAIVEYKAPSVPITQQVFTQIASYNSVLRADYLFVTNGINHYCCHIDYEAGNVEYLREIPAYTELQ